MSKVVILDRDGVILKYEEGLFINYPEQVELREGSAEAIKKLNDANYTVIVASNQGGIALGFATMKSVRDCMARMRILLYEEAEAIIDKIYFCPHHSSITECECRKPKMGMYEQMLEGGVIKPDWRKWVVGDTWMDIEFGRRIGASTIAIIEGGEWGKRDDENKVIPGSVARDLLEAVEVIKLTDAIVDLTSIEKINSSNISSEWDERGYLGEKGRRHKWRPRCKIKKKRY